MATKSSNVAVMGGVAGCLALAAIAYNTMRQTNPAPTAAPSIKPEAPADGASSYKLIDGNATRKVIFHPWWFERSVVSWTAGPY
jgi:acetyl esterase/lipase